MNTRTCERTGFAANCRPAREVPLLDGVPFCGRLVDCVSDAVISTDMEMRVTSWNRAAERMFGWKAEEAAGKNVHEILGSRFSGVTREEIRESLDFHGEVELEIRHISRDGRELTALNRVSLLLDGHGNPVGTIGVLRDITERRRMERELIRQAEELRQREKDLLGVLGVAADNAWIIDAERMEVVYASGWQNRFFSNPVPQRFPVKSCLALIHPDDRGTIERELNRCIAEETGTFSAEHRIRALDGTYLWVYSRCRTIRDGAGRGIRLYGISNDITEGKNLQLTLHAQSEELRRIQERTTLLYKAVETLLEGAPSKGMIQEACEKVMGYLRCAVFLNYVFDGDGKGTMRLNACAGVPPGLLGGIRTVAPCRCEDGCVVTDGVRHVVSDVQHSDDERLGLLKSLGVRAYACHPLIAGDAILGMLGFAATDRDGFTDDELALMKAFCSHVAVALHRLGAEAESEALANELRDKNRLITDFFTNISHEFKTPLSIILVNLQLMEYRMDQLSGEAREKFVKSTSVMRQNALRLLRLIGNLLDVTKIDAGFMKPQLVSADAVALIRGLVESVDSFASSTGVGMRFESDCERIVMPLDGEKLERILLNLLSNAIKHTPAGGSVAVSLCGRPGAVRITVKDDGEGIPWDRQEFVFDRFRQVNTSLTRSSEGCGIGLSLTKALVELLKGRIWFTSEPGAGSAFCVELPVLEESAAERLPAVEGMTLGRKVEMEFSDIHRIANRT